MNHYKVYCEWWSYGSSNTVLLTECYTAESEGEARELFWDDYPPMLGTGVIVKIEEIEE